MADIDRGSRPLSPHLQVYRPQITSILSILHRMTGVALTAGIVLITVWFFAAATSDNAFAQVHWLMTSWFGLLVWAGSLWALCFHLLNGVRHLFWDAGYGFALGTVTATGWLVVFGSFGLTALILAAVVAL